MLEAPLPRPCEALGRDGRVSICCDEDTPATLPIHTGWFVESLATQVLVIFAIRTRRTPFWRSRPSRPLVAAGLGAIVVAVTLALSPLGGFLGFASLPLPFWAALTAFVIAYLGMVELVKRQLFGRDLRLLEAAREVRAHPPP